MTRKRDHHDDPPFGTLRGAFLLPIVSGCDRLEGMENMQRPSYDDAYYRFRAKIGDHIGVGPYESISEAQMQEWVDEFKAEIDAWHESWKQIKREVKR